MTTLAVAKVTNLDQRSPRGGRDQRVLQLKVSVTNSLVVQVKQAAHKLLKVVAGKVFWKASMCLHSSK